MAFCNSANIPQAPGSMPTHFPDEFLPGMRAPAPCWRRGRDGLRRPRTVYAVGDVHGCPHMLGRLLGMVLADAARLGVERPRLGFVGDFVDRGPDSRGVLDILCSPWISGRFDWFAVRGNHEQWMLDALSGAVDPLPWLRNGGAETVESYGVRLGGSGADRAISRFAAALPDRHRAFLDSLPLAVAEGELLFVHAGVDPLLPLDRQKPESLLWIRTPFLEHAGSFGARIVHGHSPSRGMAVEALPNRIGVDTGCGFPGGRLSAAAIAPSGRVQTLTAGPSAGGIDLQQGLRSVA